MATASKVIGVAAASISKIDGVAKASISKFVGVEMVPPFVPGSATDDNAADLTLWLDADDSAQFTTSGGTTSQATRAYYKMTDGSGTSVTDSSDTGNSRNATLTNATWDSTNKALGSYSVSLNGTNAFIDATAVVADIYNTSWTISFWYKSSATGADKELFSWTATNGTTKKVILEWDDSESALRFVTHFLGFINWPLNTNIVTRKNVQDNAWHHIAVTYDGTDIITYVDGQVDVYYDTFSDYMPARASSDKLYFGRYDSNYLAANYDETGIWNQALTLTQVQELYNGGAPMSDVDIVKDEKLISQWSDKSGNDYHFTQSTTAQKPRLAPAAAGINSKPVVRFTEDANDTMTAAATLANIISADAYTVFIIFKGRYVTNAIDNANIRAQHPIIAETKGKWGVHWGYAADYTTERHINGWHRDSDSNESLGLPVGAKTAVATYSSPHVATFYMKSPSGTQYMYLDGNTTAVTQASNASVGNVSNTEGTLVLGDSSFAQYNALDGDIGEIIVYNTSLTPTDIATVVTYLSDKWGITTV